MIFSFEGMDIGDTVCERTDIKILVRFGCFCFCYCLEKDFVPYEREDPHANIAENIQLICEYSTSSTTRLY